VKVAKDENTSRIPNKMYNESDHLVEVHQLSQLFDKFFNTKIRNIVSEVQIDKTNYNRKKKLNSSRGHFMERERQHYSVSEIPFIEKHRGI
jgi:hypothetical protein